MSISVKQCKTDGKRLKKGLRLFLNKNGCFQFLTKIFNNFVMKGKRLTYNILLIFAKKFDFSKYLKLKKHNICNNCIHDMKLENHQDPNTQPA